MNQVSVIEHYLQTHEMELVKISIHGMLLKPQLLLTRLRPVERYDKFGFIDKRFGYFYGFPTQHNFSAEIINDELRFYGKYDTITVTPFKAKKAKLFDANSFKDRLKNTMCDYTFFKYRNYFEKENQHE